VKDLTGIGPGVDPINRNGSEKNGVQKAEKTASPDLTGDSSEEQGDEGQEWSPRVQRPPSKGKDSGWPGHNNQKVVLKEKDGH